MMTGPRHIANKARRTIAAFRRDDSGAAFVEFAIALPLTLVIFATIIEGGRMFWTYQATVAGVRDAARYIGRVASTDSCATSASFAGYEEKAEEIVQETITGTNFFRTSMSVSDVDTTLLCITGDYRISPMPVAQVSATLNLNFPFGAIFSLVGQPLQPITTLITDQSRVFGT